MEPGVDEVQCKIKAKASWMNRSSAILKTALVVGATTLLVAASGGGWFGINFQIKGVGAFWNPTIESITINNIVPDSPAEHQHLSVGDQIVEVEGIQVSGSKASLLRTKMKKAVGEILHLELKKQTGETYSAVLTAASKP